MRMLFTVEVKFIDKEVHVSSVSGPYSAIDPYVKPFFPPELCSQP